MNGRQKGLEIDAAFHFRLIYGLENTHYVSRTNNCHFPDWSPCPVDYRQPERQIFRHARDRIQALELRRLTLDFDGSVISTCRSAEGTAVGFNKKKKGRRSYYPLFCTVAKPDRCSMCFTAPAMCMIPMVRRRSFCAGAGTGALPGIIIEVRMDGAFFSDDIVSALDQAHIEYTISIPFERFPALKELIEQRSRWYELDAQCDYFETQWKPTCWNRRHRFILVRQEAKIQHKEPLQLDLFIPHEYGFAFKVVLTNKRLSAARAVAFHNGRGSQEGIFGELKSQNQMDYVLSRTWCGNQVYLLSALFAHNLTRELQMITRAPARSTRRKRPALWEFEQLDTLRRRMIQRAGRLIRPKGQLTLSMAANEATENEMLQILDAIECAA